MIQNSKEWSPSWGIKIISWHRSFKRRKKQRSQDINWAELIQSGKCIIWDQLIQTLFVGLKLKCDCVSNLLPGNWTLELLRNKLQIRDLVWQVGKDNVFCSRKQDNPEAILLCSRGSKTDFFFLKKSHIGIKQIKADNL